MSVVFYAVSIGVCIPITIYLLMKNLPVDNLSLTLLTHLTAWPATLIGGLWLIKRPWRESYSIGFFSPRLLPAVITSCFGLSFLLNRLSSILPMPKLLEDMFRSFMDGPPWLVFLSLSILTPIAEELFFRGRMLRGFMANYSVKKSIWLTAIIFALFHLNPWQFFVALPLGLLFAWFVRHTGSLAPGIIGHFVVNVTSTVLLLPVAHLFGYSAETMGKLTHLPWEMVVMGAVLSLIGIYGCWYEFNKATACSSSEAK